MANFRQSYDGLSTFYRLSILLAGLSCLANAEIDNDSADRRTVKIGKLLRPIQVEVIAH